MSLAGNLTGRAGVGTDMRLLTSAAVLSCACAAVLSGVVAGAPSAKPRLVANRPVETGARWIGVVAASRRPAVTARLGRRTQAVTVRRLRPGRFQLRAIFRQAGRWTLWDGRQQFGTVLVRQAPLRLTNAMDVVVEPSGSLLVSDFSDRVFRLDGQRLTLVAGNGRPGYSGDGGPADAGGDRLPGRDRGRSAGRLRNRPRGALDPPRRSGRDDQRPSPSSSSRPRSPTTPQETSTSPSCSEA